MDKSLNRYAPYISIYKITEMFKSNMNYATSHEFLLIKYSFLK